MVTERGFIPAGHRRPWRRALCDVAECAREWATVRIAADRPSRFLCCGHFVEAYRASSADTSSERATS